MTLAHFGTRNKHDSCANHMSLIRNLRAELEREADRDIIEKQLRARGLWNPAWGRDDSTRGTNNLDEQATFHILEPSTEFLSRAYPQ